METITLSKRRDFKNIKGQFCYINTRENKLYIDLQGCQVLYDVDTSYTKPNLILILSKEASKIIEELDSKLESLIKNKTYVSLRKVATNKKFSDTIKLKLLDPPKELLRKTKISVHVHVSGMWFDEHSAGPYMSVESYTIPVKECAIVPDSDSEIDI
jgi:hypothetical protein